MVLVNNDELHVSHLGRNTKFLEAIVASRLTPPPSELSKDGVTGVLRTYRFAHVVGSFKFATCNNHEPIEPTSPTSVNFQTTLHANIVDFKYHFTNQHDSKPVCYG